MVKTLPANAGDAGDIGLIPGSGRSHGGGNGNTLQFLSHFADSIYTEHTFITLMKSSLSVISFMDCAFGVVSRKDITIPKIV